MGRLIKSVPPQAKLCMYLGHSLVLPFAFGYALALSVLVESKAIIGEASGGLSKNIGHFCYVIPPQQNGRLIAETVIEEGGQQLVLLNHTLQKTESTKYGCEKLLQEARLKEYLGPYSQVQKGSLVKNHRTLYHLSLDVHPHFNDHFVTAMLTNCNGSLKALYHLEFNNPGGFFIKHFSCEEQGIFQIYLLFTVLSALMGINILLERKHHSSYDASDTVVSLIYLSHLIFFTHVILFSVFLCGYAWDGSGFPVLKFLSQLCAFALDLIITLTFLFLASGISITRSYLQENEAYQVFYFSFLYALLRVIYTLADSQYFDVHPYTSLRTGWSIPVIAVQLIFWVRFGYIATHSWINEAEAEKRNLFLRLILTLSFWFLSLTVLLTVRRFSTIRFDASWILLRDVITLLSLNYFFSRPARTYQSFIDRRYADKLYSYTEP